MNNTMEQSAKIQFLLSLSSAVIDAMIEDIENDRVPTCWNGHYIRQWLADRFAEQVTDPSLKDGRTRGGKEYRNTRAVNNI